jgi:hypothetical protein
MCLKMVCQYLRTKRRIVGRISHNLSTLPEIRVLAG